MDDRMSSLMTRMQRAAQGIGAIQCATGGRTDAPQGISAPQGYADGGQPLYRASDPLFNSLLQQESGNRDIQGPLVTAGANAGDRAFGPAQIMPKTASDPGYGVTPMNMNAPDMVAENRRFGRDYLNAMINEFGGDE
jgi:hypothetical protein